MAALETVRDLAAGDPQYWANEFAPLSVDTVTASFDFTPSPHSKLAPAWTDFCLHQGGKIYEYQTQEYLTAFGTYLAHRVAAIRARHQERTRFLEVAAGQGRLAFLLDHALRDMGADADFIAVDDFSWQEYNTYPSLAVPVDFRDALHEVKPHIVLGAWLPAIGRGGRLPWTQVMRAQASVQEYILIGKPEGHADTAAWDGSAERAGFEQAELEHLQPYQLAYMSTTPDMHPSATIAFRRN